MTTPTGGNNNDPPPRDSPGTGPRPVDIPAYFRGYEATYFSSLGRAELAGANDDQLRQMREAMYDGWMRPNRYDEHGNETFGYRERREARQTYERLADTLEENFFDKNNADADAGFDWDQWREDYEEANAA